MARSTTRRCSTRYFTSAAVFLLVACGAIGTSTSNAADECIAKPDSQPPRGSHWYYRLDRATQRKCWYVAAEGERAARRETTPVRRQLAKPAEPQPERRMDAADVATPAVAEEGREPRLPPRWTEANGSEAGTVMTGPAAVPSVRRAPARQLEPRPERTIGAGAAADEVDDEHERQPLPRWTDASGSRSGIVATKPGSSLERDFMAPEDGPAMRSMRDARPAATSDGSGPSLGIEYLLACLAGILAVAGLLAGRIARRERAPVRIRRDLVPSSVLVPSPPLAGDAEEGAPWRKLPAMGSDEDHRSYAPARYAARSRWPDKDVAEAARSQSPRAPASPRRGDEDLESKLQRLLHDWKRAAA
jgi:hypothetical protein